MSDKINESNECPAALESQGSTAGNYAIGYRKPPKAHQFKKGRSGNPKGRLKEKKVDDVRRSVNEIFAETVKVHEADRIRSVSNLELMLRTHWMQALKGNAKAAVTFFKFGQKAGVISEINPEALVGWILPGGDDEKIIRMFRAEQEERAHSEDNH